MEIATGDDFSRINQNEWIVSGTVHLGGDDFLREFNRIPWYAMNLE